MQCVIAHGKVDRFGRVAIDVDVLLVDGHETGARNPKAPDPVGQDEMTLFYASIGLKNKGMVGLPKIIATQRHSHLIEWIVTLRGRKPDCIYCHDVLKSLGGVPVGEMASASAL